MKLKFNLTRSDIELFRQIPKRTHHSHVIHAHPNSFTGKEAVIFMKNTFNVTDEEAEQLGNLLLQGNVIKALTYRTQPNFSPNSRSIYTTEDPEKEYLFWLQAEVADPDDVSTFSESTGRDSFEKGKNIPSMGTMVPFFGNALQVVSPTETNRSMQRLGREICRQHPEGVFRMNLVGHQYIVVCDPYHVQTIFESQCFGKQTHNDAIFKELRAFRGDGLTTVEDGTLHATCQGVIAPCLTKSRFLGYLPTIIATLQQTFAEELENRKKPVDMRYFWKKCTLRAVAKVAMSVDIYDDEEDWDRFSDGLTYVADEAINRVFKASKFVPIFNYKFKSEVRYMHKKMNSFIEKRREQHKLNPKDPKDYDLLDVMMFSSIGEENGRPVYMTSELIRANLTTILSAGHSTTTSMLSWTCNFLYDVSLGNTDYRYHLISEIDAVSGGDRSYVPTLDDVYKRMGFLTCVLKESLRLVPPIPSIVRHCVESTFLGDYPIQKGDTIMISALGTHLNKKSWGDNADEFNPYRFEKQPPLPCAFIPWAGGARQCIGREFALLVGRVALFTLLNQYTLEMAPEAHVKEDEHLFIFPTGLLMNVSKRRQLHGSSAKSVASPSGEQASSGSLDSPSQVKIEKTVETWEGLKQLVRNAGHQVYILAGTQSECGNVNKVANWLVDKATTFNFKIGDGVMDPNDFLKIINDPEEETPEHVKAVSKIIAIVTATYQGKPAANTVEFFNWLAKKRAQLPEKPELAQLLSRYSFIVFGCGHSNWITTYQKVGKFIDETMELLGAKRIVPYYCFNEDSDDLEECFESFYKTMAPRLMHSLPQIGEQRLRQVNKGLFWQASRIQPQMQSSAIAMQVLGNAEDIGFPPVLPSAITSKNIQACKIRDIKNITPNADRKTLHIEIELHESMKYIAGDHIVICPVMPTSLVQRVISQFVDTDGNTVVQWNNVFGGKPNRFHLPLGVPLTVSNILTNLVDLKATPTKQFLMNMSTIVVNEEHAAKLKHISDNQYREWVAENEPVSVVDVIEWFPVGSDRLDRLLEILPVTRPRQYSISSSPLKHPDVAHVCIGVVEDMFPNQKVYQGVSSHYLSTLIGTSDSKINAYIEPADPTFRVPADDTKPMILISAGTGFAPMRGFIQERYARKATGPIYCFFGCRNEEQDLLYADELEQYQKEGFLTEWHVGYSRSSKYPSEYVQQKIEQRGEAVWQWLEAGAYIYICGSGSRVGTGSRDVIAKIIAQYGNTNPDEYIDKLTDSGRYELDVWG